MASLVHPRSELIREPRLLVPRMQPLGPVWNTMKSGLKVAWSKNNNLLYKPEVCTVYGTPSAVGGPNGIGAYFGSGNYLYNADLIQDDNGAGTDRTKTWADLLVIVPTASSSSSVMSQNNAASTDPIWGGVSKYWNQSTLTLTDQGFTATAVTLQLGKCFSFVRSYENFAPYSKRLYCNGVLLGKHDGYYFQGKTVFLGSGYPAQWTGGHILLYALWQPAGHLSQQFLCELSRDPFSVFVPA